MSTPTIRQPAYFRRYQFFKYTSCIPCDDLCDAVLALPALPFSLTADFLTALPRYIIKRKRIQNELNKGKEVYYISRLKFLKN